MDGDVLKNCITAQFLLGVQRNPIKPFFPRAVDYHLGHRDTALEGVDQPAKRPDFLECHWCSYERGLTPTAVSLGPALVRCKVNLRSH